MKKFSSLFFSLFIGFNLFAQQPTSTNPDHPPRAASLDNAPQVSLHPGDLLLDADLKFPETVSYKVQMLIDKQWRDTGTAILRTVLNKDKSQLWQLFTTTIANNKSTDSSLVNVKDFNALYYSSTSKQNSLYVNFANSKISGTQISSGKKEIIEKAVTEKFFNPQTFYLLFAGCNDIEQLQGKTITVFDDSKQVVTKYTIHGVKTEMLADNPDEKKYVVSMAGDGRNLTYFIDGLSNTTTRFEIRKDGLTVGYTLLKK